MRLYASAVLTEAKVGVKSTRLFVDDDDKFITVAVCALKIL